MIIENRGAQRSESRAKPSCALGAVAPIKTLLLLAAVAVACDANLNYADGGIRVTTIAAPDQTEFATVSPVFERRCGTLDCHGQVGRPLRIYSGLGLRLPNDAGNVPGIGATTPDEITTNYRCIIGLEPEEMTRVVDLIDPPRTLLILAKPLMLEAHKGGPAMAPTNDPAETCITSWLLGAGVDTAACAQAVQ
jgi:hypothetical protein